MQSLLERFLYISLALAFIGVGIEGVYVISSTHKLDLELKNQATELRDIQDIDHNLQQGIAGLKASNNQQTAEIQCLLSALNVGTFPGNCQAAPTNPTPSAPSTPLTPSTTANPPSGGSISNNGSAPQSPSNPGGSGSTGGSTNPPSGNGPGATAVNRVVDTVKHLLGRVGL